MDIDLLRKIEAVYTREHLVGRQRAHACVKCKLACEKDETYIAGPVLPWHIGKDYRKSKTRILFVGKWWEVEQKRFQGHMINTTIEEMHTSWSPYFNNDGNKTIPEDTQDLTRFSPFWQFIHAVSNGVFKDPRSAFRKVAVTNLVKCVRKDKKEYDNALIENCVKGLEIFQKEQKVLKPGYVLFTTGPFGAPIVEKLVGYDYECQSRKTTSRFSRKRNPAYIWLYHPSYLRRNGLFDIAVKEAVDFILHSN